MSSRLQQEIRLFDLRELAAPTNEWGRSAPIIGLAFCLLLYYVAITFQAATSFQGSTIPLDYGSLYASVFAWAHHLNPYLDYPLTLNSALIFRGRYTHAVNLNPPASLYLFRPIVALGPLTSAQLWTFASALLFIVSLVLVVRANPNPALRQRILLVLGMAGVWYTFQMGQIYMVLLLLTTAAWLAFRKKAFFAAGLAIGIICALKPDFLVWPVLLVLARHRKAGISALATFAAATLAPLASANGLQTYRQWSSACRYFNGVEYLSNSAIAAMCSRMDNYLGISHNYRDFGYGLTVLLLLAVAWIALRRAPDVWRTSELALLATLLAGPISWVGYTLVLIPMLYERRLNSLMRIGWIILCIPLFLVYWMVEGSHVRFILMGSPYFYGLVLIGASLIRGIYRKQEERLAISADERPMADARIPSSVEATATP